MIERQLLELQGTRGEAIGTKWHSIRLLHAEDGMGVAISGGVPEQGFKMMLWRKNRLEARVCIEGEATVEELDNGTAHQIRPGTLYVMNSHDRHEVKITKRTRRTCTFFPALTGQEVHDEDGSL